jgi:host factor-I protein
MSKAAMNLQDSFLNQVRRENSEVRVLLVNGTLLRGMVKGFDNFTLILNNRNGQHLVYKHAIAQIVTHRHHARHDEHAAPEGTEENTGSAAAEEVNQAEEKPKSSHAEPNPAKAEGGSQEQGRQKHRKDGFNKLDLSQVKLDASEKR